MEDRFAKRDVNLDIMSLHHCARACHVLQGILAMVIGASRGRAQQDPTILEECLIVRNALQRIYHVPRVTTSNYVT
jgi:uncharacterized protein with PQ loop repeat